MARPPAITRFERLWWGSTILSGLSSLLSWDRVRNSIDERFAQDPRLRGQEVASVVADWAQWTGVLTVLVWTALVWYLAARRASPVGKWLAVLTAALSVAQLLILTAGLLAGRTLHPLSQACAAGAGLLAIAAAAALFRPDARLWFGELDADEEEVA